MKKSFILLFVFVFLFSFPFSVFAVGDEPENSPAPDPAPDSGSGYVPMTDEEINDVYDLIAETRLMLSDDDSGSGDSDYTDYQNELLTTLGYIYTILLVFVVVLGCYLIYKFFNLFF